MPRPIKEYEELYLIYPNGKVYSLPKSWSNQFGGIITRKGKFLKPNPVKGYHHITLCKNGKHRTFQLHRVVGMNFIPNPQVKPVINHKNGIKTDNRVENLEWCTLQENVQHAYETGLSHGQKGSRNPHAKLSEGQVKRIRTFPELTQLALAKKFGVGRTTIQNIRNGKSWTSV